MTTTMEAPDMAKARAKAKESTDMVRYGAYIRADQAEALDALRAQGVNPAHVIREAIDAALAARGVKVKGARHGR